MTDEELAGQPGAVATRSEGGETDPASAEPVFSPRDFKLNLGVRLAQNADEPLPNHDSPAIRKLTWEHVVPDRPASSASSAATTAPLPLPRRVPPPPPVATFQPPAPVVEPEPVVERHPVEELGVEDEAMDDIEIEEHVFIGEADLDDMLDEDFGDEDDREFDDGEDVVESPTAMVQPEINRLSLVPDLIDDDSPVELPPITPSGSMVVHEQVIYMPVLAETVYVPPPARTAGTVTPVAVAPGQQKRRKQKRRMLRSIMTFVLLLGLLAGGAFAAKKYLLQPETWTVEMKPLADEVAAARGLEFKVAVKVTPLPVADYAARLGASTVGKPAESAPTWRALGLLNGELDLEAVGRQALNESPAFYDPASKTIYLSDDLVTYEHLHHFALHRALTVALLDQQFSWSTRAATASPAAALAIRATIDGDALAVANSLAAKHEPDQLAPELSAFVQGHANTVSPSQYAASVAGRAGAAMLPTIMPMLTTPAALTALEQATPSSDAAFDIARPDATVASPPGTQGMMFWYYVLASRIDDGQALSAAVRWTADSLTTSMGSVSHCVEATVAAADVDSASVLLGAFQAWAATAAAESTTTAVLIEGNQVAIRACDPGATITSPLPIKVPVLFGGAAVERALVQAATTAAGTAKLDAACLVNAARQRGTIVTSPADDSPAIALAWHPPYVAANLDLAITCLTPA